MGPTLPAQRVLPALGSFECWKGSYPREYGALTHQIWALLLREGTHLTSGVCHVTSESSDDGDKFPHVRVGDTFPSLWVHLVWNVDPPEGVWGPLTLPLGHGTVWRSQA